MRPRALFTSLLTASLLSGCASGEASSNAADTQSVDDAAQQAHIREVVANGGVVDSILPVAEQLHRFRQSLPVADSLTDATSSIPALVARLATALEARDTSALNIMTLSRSEFAYLYYPGSAMSRPPYEAPPALLWGQIVASSNAGAVKLLQRFGGRRVAVDSLDCPTRTADGDNVLHERCRVQFSAEGGPSMSGNLFGTIIERNGKFKFLSLANRI